VGVTNQQILEVLSEVRVDVKGLKVHVVGNGGKGLLTRQDETEAWIAKRPRVCPATSREMMKSVIRAVSVATGILGLIVALSVLGDRFLKKDDLAEVKKELQALQTALEKLAQ
jgi:hypothetical protein